MKLTLELNPKQLVDIAQYLAGHTATLPSPTSDDRTVEDTLPAKFDTSPLEAPKHFGKTLPYPDDMPMDNKPATVKPTATIKNQGTKTSMPSFGRTQTQVDSYESSEEARIDKLDEENEAKAERAEVRAIRKQEIDDEKAEKNAIKQKATDEVAAIKSKDDEPVKVPTKIKKPWAL